MATTKRQKQLIELMATEMAWVTMTDLAGERSKLNLDRGTLRLAVPAHDERIAREMGAKLCGTMQLYYRARKLRQQFPDASEQAVLAHVAAMPMNTPDRDVLDAMAMNIRDQGPPYGSTLQVTLDLNLLPGWEHASSQAEQKALINEHLVKILKAAYDQVRAKLPPDVVRDVDNLPKMRKPGAPPLQEPLPLPAPKDGSKMKEEIIESHTEALNHLDLLRYNPNPTRGVTIGYSAKDRTMALQIAMALLQASAPTNDPREQILYATQICASDPNAPAYDETTGHWSIHIEPQNVHPQWSIAVDLMQNRIQKTLNLVHVLEGKSASQMQNIASIFRQGVQEAASQSPDQATLAKQQKKLERKQKKLEELAAAESQIEHDREAQKAAAQKAAEARKIDEAKIPQPFDLKEVEAGIQYLEKTPPLAHKGKAEILADAVRSLAAAMDLRDGETLKLAGYDDAECAKRIEAAAMQRELANMLLSRANLLQAAKSVELPKMFGEPVKSHRAEREHEERVAQNADYLRNHADARAFIEQYSTEIPGLMLLVQASMVNKLEDLQQEAKDWLQGIGTDLKEAKEFLALEPELYRDQTAAYLKSGSSPQRG